jgi:hypothetical protein
LVLGQEVARFDADPRKGAGRVEGIGSPKRSIDLGVSTLSGWQDLAPALNRAVVSSAMRYRDEHPTFRRLYRDIRHTGYQIQHYRPGGDDGFDWHADIVDLATSNRILAMILYRFDFPDVDSGNVRAALAVALDPARNPALAFLRDRAVPAILAAPPELIGVALVHPDQIPHVLLLGRLLRGAGYDGALVVYGAHEDVVAPEDFADDLAAEPDHLLFDFFDGVIVGEAETPLLALADAVAGGRAKAGLPGLLAPRWGLTAPPRPVAEQVETLPPPDYSLVDRTIYPFPEPIVDLRLSRSCPWNRCTFCAITSHQAGYRARPTAAVARDLIDAEAHLGTTFFRFRDDLLTPAQLREMAEVVSGLPFRPRWSARARFEAGLDRETLRAAAAAGLEELWLGLESASMRVRNLMVKGVAQRVVERILVDAAAAGIRVRALCMVGYPGETEAELRATVDFLRRHVAELAHVALTPFQLMRKSPLGRDPERHGLRVRPDAVPRAERIRFSFEADGDDLLAPAAVRAILDEITGDLFAATARGYAGPTLSHAWLRASVARGGWPKASAP